MDITTFGKDACFQTLVSITNEHKDNKLNGKVCRILDKARKTYKLLRVIENPTIFRMTLIMWRDHYFKDAAGLSLPSKVETHLRCCLMAIYRDELIEREVTLDMRRQKERLNATKPLKFPVSV